MNSADISMVGEDGWEEARRCLPVIRQLAGKEDRTREDVLAAASVIGCGPTRVYKLLRRFRADTRLTGLTSERRGFPAGQSRLDARVDALICEMIDDFFLTRQKPRITDLVVEVQRRCRDQGLAAPGRKAVASRVRMRPAARVTRKRNGAKAANDRFMPVTGSLESGWPLALIQIDHTLVDVIVVDSETRAPIQRPWLTVAIDVHSRCVAGFHLSLEPPSATSVALCLSHAALAKDAWLAERGIEAEWPVRGIPERLHLDNAKEFRCEALKRGCEQYGIAIDYRPVRTPHYGGHIERLIGTMMGKVHLLPGTTFSNVQAKGDLNPDKTAAMTLDEVERWLGHAIAGVYHRTVHRGISTTPVAAWERGIAGDGAALGRGEPTAVADPRRFLIDFLPIERRLVRREGIALHSINYWSDVLSAWVGHTERMIVRYDPRDLSRIYLLGLDGVYYDLSYRDLRRPPISLWEHRLAYKRLRAEGRAHVDEAAIFRAIEAMRTIADEAVSASKAARRQRARRLRVIQGGKEAPPPDQPPDAATVRQVSDGRQPYERMFPFEEWS